MDKLTIPKPTLRRLPFYLNYLKTLPKETRTISATAIAEALGQGEVQVRKDLSAASASGGRPKMGYTVSTLIADLEDALGCNDPKHAVLVGVGRLGGALLSFTAFARYGMYITAAFDNDPAKIGTTIGGTEIMDIARLGEVCRAQDIHIGILTTSPGPAQQLARQMTDAGILAIWNFSTAHLEVPEGIIVYDEDLTVSLAMISRALDAKLEAEAAQTTT